MTFQGKRRFKFNSHVFWTPVGVRSEKSIIHGCSWGILVQLLYERRDSDREQAHFPLSLTFEPSRAVQVVPRF